MLLNAESEIFLEFVGGARDGEMLAGPLRPTSENKLLMDCYRQCDHGSVGSRFQVSTAVGLQCYEIVRRYDLSASIILRALFVTSDQRAIDLDEIYLRR